ncbi:hypothetical protein M2266_005486 [Streptomyces sp. SPB162]|nr:hypothetical protein [Streptomyces sp. SPB162]
MAEPRGDELAHGHVLADPGPRQHVVERQPGQARGRQQAGGRERPQIAGDSHDVPLRHRPQPAPGPHGGARRGRWLQPVAEPHLAGQCDRFRPAREHRLGAQVHGHAGDLVGVQLPAEPRGALQHRHPRAAAGQVVGGGESGDPAADDDHMPCSAVCVGHALHCPRFPNEL